MANISDIIINKSHGVNNADNLHGNSYLIKKKMYIYFILQALPCQHQPMKWKKFTQFKKKKKGNHKIHKVHTW